MGASVVNALSKWLKVEVYFGGKLYEQEYESVFEGGKLHAGKPKYALREAGATNRRGTKISYLADDTVFDDLHLHFDRIARRLRELAFLIQGRHDCFGGQARGQEPQALF